jgi:hypothetical protein
VLLYHALSEKPVFDKDLITVNRLHISPPQGHFLWDVVLNKRQTSSFKIFENK